MFCEKCGAPVSENNRFCSKCGFNLGTTEDQVVVCNDVNEDEVVISNTDINAPLEENMAFPFNNKKSKSILHNKPLLIILVFVIAAGVVFFSWQAIGRAQLKSKLMKDWSRIEKSGSSYYELVLDFSDEEVDYNYDCGVSWINSTIATYKYKVVSPNKVEFTENGHSTVVTIKFNDDKTMITMTPALVSSDSFETWFSN